jgi:hypothetical protein
MTYDLIRHLKGYNMAAELHVCIHIIPPQDAQKNHQESMQKKKNSQKMFKSTIFEMSGLAFV